MSPKRQKPYVYSASRRATMAAGALYGSVLGLITMATPAQAGDIKMRYESPASFNAVQLDVPADFRVQIGSRPKVTLEAEPKVLKALRVNSAGGLLTINSQGSFQTQKPIIITITTPSLTEISALGASDVTVGPLQGDRLTVKAEGSTTISIEKLNLRQFLAHLRESSELRAVGSAKVQQVKVNDSASYEGMELKTITANLKVSGAGSAEVAVEEELDVKIVDSGSVTYSGNPRINKAISDAGSLDTE